jgi:hypothetical protein
VKTNTTNDLIAQPAWRLLALFLGGAIAVATSSCCAPTASSSDPDRASPPLATFAGTVVLAPEDCAGAGRLRMLQPLWEPSEDQAAQALASLTAALHQPHPNPLTVGPHHQGDVINLRRNVTNEVCQAIGVTYKTQRAVLLNCFPVRSFFAEERYDRFVSVNDGGPGYWSVLYLPEKRRFTRLRINGGW